MAGSFTPALRRFIACVVLGGWIAAAIVSVDAHRSNHRDAMVLILVCCTILAELAPIRIPFRGGVQDISVSTTFVFALVLLHDLPAAFVAQVASVGGHGSAATKPVFVPVAG